MINNGSMQVPMPSLQFQSPWNTVIYSIQNFNINNQLSTYFELDATTGNVRVRIPLYNDNTDSQSYTFTVTATDGGGRTAIQNAQVTINVIRNLFPPRFTNVPYSTIVPFTVGSGFTVFDVNATDSDTTVSIISRTVQLC